MTFLNSKLQTLIADAKRKSPNFELDNSLRIELKRLLKRIEDLQKVLREQEMLERKEEDEKEAHHIHKLREQGEKELELIIAQYSAFAHPHEQEHHHASQQTKLKVHLSIDLIALGVKSIHDVMQNLFGENYLGMSLQEYVDISPTEEEASVAPKPVPVLRTVHRVLGKDNKIHTMEILGNVIIPWSYEPEALRIASVMIHGFSSTGMNHHPRLAQVISSALLAEALANKIRFGLEVGNYL